MSDYPSSKVILDGVTICEFYSFSDERNKGEVQLGFINGSTVLTYNGKTIPVIVNIYSDKNMTNVYRCITK